MWDWLVCDTMCRKIPSFYSEFSFLVQSPSLRMTINTHTYIHMIKPEITPSAIHLFILEEEVRNFHSALSLKWSNISREVLAITLPVCALNMQICKFCLVGTKNNHFSKSQHKYYQCNLLCAGVCPTHAIK